jgi:hypothetical protein
VRTVIYCTQQQLCDTTSTQQRAWDAWIDSSPEALRLSAGTSQQGGKKKFKQQGGIPILLSKSASSTAILSLLEAQEASPAAIQLAKDVEQKKDAMRRLQEGSADAAADVAAAVTRLEAVKLEAAQAVAVVARYSSFGMARMDSLAADRALVAGQGAAARGQQGALLFLLNSVAQHVARVEAALRGLAALQLQPTAVSVSTATASPVTDSAVTAASETASVGATDDINDGYDGVARAVVMCLLAVSSGTAADSSSAAAAAAAAAASAQSDVNDDLLSLDFNKVKAAGAGSGSSSDAPTVEVNSQVQVGEVDKEGQLLRAVLTEAVKASHLETRSGSSSPSRRRTTLAKRGSTAPSGSISSGSRRRRTTAAGSKGKRARPSTVGSIAEGSSVSSSALATDSVTLDGATSLVDSTAASSASGTVDPLLTAASVTADGIAPPQQQQQQQQQHYIPQQQQQVSQYEHRSGKRQSLVSELAEIDQLAAAAHFSAPLISSSSATAASNDTIAQQTAAYFAELDAATEPLQKVEDEFGISDTPSSTTGSTVKFRETKAAESLRLAQTYEAAISGVFSAERAAAAAAAAAAEAAARQQQLEAALAAVTSAGAAAAAAAAARSDAASTTSTVTTVTKATDADRCGPLDSGDAPRSAQPLVLFLNGLGSRRARDDYPEPPEVPLELSLPAGKLHPTHEHKAAFDSYLLLNFTVEQPAATAVPVAAAAAAVSAAAPVVGSANRRSKKLTAAAVVAKSVHSEEQLRAMWCTVLSSNTNTASTASTTDDMYEQVALQQQQKLQQRWQRRYGKRCLGSSVSVLDEKALTRERYTGDDASTVQLQTPGPFLWLGRMYHCGTSTDTDDCDGRDSRMNTAASAVSDAIETDEVEDDSIGAAVMDSTSSLAFADSERDDRAYTEDIDEVQKEALAVEVTAPQALSGVIETDGDLLMPTDTELNNSHGAGIDSKCTAAAGDDVGKIADSSDAQLFEGETTAARQLSTVSELPDEQHSGAVQLSATAVLTTHTSHDKEVAMPASASIDQTVSCHTETAEHHGITECSPRTSTASSSAAAAVSFDERVVAPPVSQQQPSSGANRAVALREPQKHPLRFEATLVPAAAAAATVAQTAAATAATAVATVAPILAQAEAAVAADTVAVVNTHHAILANDDSAAAVSDSMSIGSGSWDAASSSTITPRTITTATARAARCSSANSRGASTALHPRHSSSRHKQRQQQQLQQQQQKQQLLQRRSSGSISSGTLPSFAGGKRSSWNDPGIFLETAERVVQERPVTVSHYERPPSLFDPVVEGVLVRASSSSNHSGTGDVDRDSTLYRLSDEALAAVRSSRSKTAVTRKKRGLGVVGLRALPLPIAATAVAAAATTTDSSGTAVIAQQHAVQEHDVVVDAVPHGTALLGDNSSGTVTAHGHVVHTPETAEQHLQHSSNGGSRSNSSSAVSALLYQTAAPTSATTGYNNTGNTNTTNTNNTKSSIICSSILGNSNSATRKLSERGTSPLRGTRVDTTLPLHSGASHPETSTPPSSTSPNPGTEYPPGDPPVYDSYTDVGAGRNNDVSAILKSLSQSLLQQADVRTLGQRPLTGASRTRGKLFKTKPQPLLMQELQQQQSFDVDADTAVAAVAVQVDNKFQNDGDYGPLSNGLVGTGTGGSVRSFTYSSSDVSAVLAQSRAATARSSTAQRKARHTSGNKQQDAEELFDGLAACDWDVRALGTDAVVARAATANTGSAINSRTLLHSRTDGAVRGKFSILKYHMLTKTC